MGELQMLRPIDDKLTFWDLVFWNEMNTCVAKCTEEFENMRFMAATKWGAYDLFNARYVRMCVCIY